MKTNYPLPKAKMPSRPGLATWNTLRRYTLWLNSKVKTDGDLIKVGRFK